MYLFAPLDKHYDKGFGAVADSFQDAARALKEQYTPAMLNGHLPICYLFRHSIELYLKGSIIIVHQGLKIPYGTEPCTTEPKIPVNGKPKSIYAIHDIDLLYKYLSSLLIEKQSELEEVTNTNWVFENEISAKFERLKEVDPASSYFRYPTEKSATFEKDKSAFKETTVEQVMATAVKNQEPMKSMKVIQLIGREPQIFVHDDSFTQDAMELLYELADKVSTCHFALMNELGGGGFVS